MTPNINSPTAKELATKSIVELSLIVYQNALAVKEMAEAISGVDERAVAAADAAHAGALRAEKGAADADGGAINAYRDALRAGEYADDAETAANNAANAAQMAADALDAAGDALAAKLDKVATDAARARVYAVSRTGNQYMHTISGSSEHHNGALPIYTETGTLRSATPQADDDLATKQYVDDNAGGGGMDVHYWDGNGQYRIPNGRGAVLIPANSTTVFWPIGVPPVSNVGFINFGKGVGLYGEGGRLECYAGTDDDGNPVWVLSVTVTGTVEIPSFTLFYV